MLSDQKVTFRLTSGRGPVHLSGTHATESTVDDDEDANEDDLLDGEEEDEDEEEEQVSR